VNQTEDKFCWVCGVPLSEKPTLAPCACGKRLSEFDHFCPACGKAVERLAARVEKPS
jgi:predicted amidophosphoribosyltransferase